MPGAPQEWKAKVRASLAATLERWQHHGDLALTEAAGWGPGAPGTSTETWDTILGAAARACDAVGRWSEAQLSYSPYGNEPRVQQLKTGALINIDRLAAAVLQELGDSMNPQAVLAAADQFVDEVVDEDCGLLHACDSVGSLLQARLVCAEDRIELPDSELSHAAIQILAPLLAQRAAIDPL